MGQGAWPVPITAVGDAAAAAVVWRRPGQLHLTVVVKGTFALCADRVMTPSRPDPCEIEERDLDLAPRVERVDIRVTGHASISAGSVASARLGVFRDQVALLDKSTPLEAPRGTAPGSIARVPLRGLEDQRLEALRGDEWIVLAGAHADRPSLATRLPGAVGWARLHGGPPAPGTDHAHRLTAETVTVDVDRGLCSITCRARLPIAEGCDLARLHVVAGLELPGKPLVWPERFESTIEVDSGALARAAAKAPVTPFAAGSSAGAAPARPPASPAARPVEGFGATAELSPEDAAAVRSAMATPFKTSAAVTAAPPTQGYAPMPAARVEPRPAPRAPEGGGAAPAAPAYLGEASATDLPKGLGGHFLAAMKARR